MTILSLNHYTVRTMALEPMRHFYEEVVGLVSGDRPPFDFPGYWLYGGDGTAVLHLIGVAEKPGGANGSGAIDHIAFLCRDADAVRTKLRSMNVPFQERVVPMVGMLQLFLLDPEGIKLELNFPA